MLAYGNDQITPFLFFAMKIQQIKNQRALLVGLLLDLPRYIKRSIAVSVDISLCFMGTWAAFSLRLNKFVEPSAGFFLAAALSALIAIPVFISYGLYRAIFRYHGLPAIYELCKAMIVYSILFSCIITFLGVNGVPRTVGIIQPLLLFLLVWSSRSAVQFSLGNTYKRRIKANVLNKALIYGAGQTGRQLVFSLKDSREVNVVGFIDDDKTIQGQQLYGCKVYAPSALKNLIKEQEVSTILLAIPSVGRKKRNSVLEKLSEYNVAVRTVPSLADIAQGRVTNSDILPLNLEDLLGREMVEPDNNLLMRNIWKKTILVTGAGGSIGSELCRQILKLNCQKLILIDFNEYALYSIHSELENIAASLTEKSDIKIIPILTSIQQKERMSKIISEWKPDVIYHAAAYKHVHLVEENLEEGINNNVISSIHLAEAALEHGASHFVYVSTDKAVRPTNVMGASKRLAEISLQSLFKKNSNVDCKLAIVRFGNVLASSGSVIPKFRKQIENGGPITLTHPEITRYFMTIPEAVHLVIQASALVKRSDVFVLDMGEPVKIFDLARRMVELSGLTLQTPENPSGDIEILVTGLRPGEKLFEELLVEDNAQSTEHSKIFRASGTVITWDLLIPELETLKMQVVNSDDKGILSTLLKAVDNYEPSEEIINKVEKNPKKLM